MSNPPPPSIPGGTPPPPSIPTPPAAPSVPKAPAAPAVPPVAAAPAAPAAPPAAAAPTIPLRPAGLGGGIKLGGGLKTVALGSATTPVAPVVPPAGAAPAAAAPTVPLTPPGAGMATAQLPQATIGLNTAPAASPVSSASFTARKFQEDTDAAPSTLLNVLSFVALAFALIFIGYQYATDTLEARSMVGWLGGDSKPAPAAPAADEETADDVSSETSAEEPSDDGADAEE
ncbi:hypothetical protein C1O51_03990 [Akkermansia muciniphila]|uniref:hypothetical protein n=1 Tax=Akkermansia muciniphila TaxID=239935 RepID=UPI000A57F9D4|nr:MULTISPECIES: hypothetical protein [Akkermansia]AYR27289.1 hypothetical protein CUB89_01070 [Akkermansia muciniphila]MBS5975059.1 hypothetical protein [Akkermansia muciniphila]MBT8786966.1 hypothetical protein [Akkermansia muciniphila]MCO6190442.1 hypothetical protein [Akkermansia muciniphila]QAA52423.1 hypothetical protein C1O50_03985 [Akkermansia muciniphila]